MSLCAAALVLGTLSAPAQAIQCVPYAREVSGLNIKGNAWQWWQAAAGVYDRGRSPRDGAVLVFARQGSMRYGHVSVVTRVVSSRLALVDHANWAPAGSSGRGKVAQSVPVLDVSSNNDWSQVRVWHRPAADFGSKIYRTDGFVYNPGATKPTHRPAIEKVALTKAASVFPKDKALARLSEHKAAQPAAAIVAAPAAQPLRTEKTAPAAPEGVVRQVHHVTPAAGPARPTVNDLIFN